MKRYYHSSELTARVITLMVATLFFVFAMALSGKGEVRMGINPRTGGIDVVVDNLPLITGLYPEVISEKGTLSPENGSLKLSEVVESDVETGEFGEYVTTTLKYEDESGAEAVHLLLRIYLEENAATVGFEFVGSQALVSEGGLRLVFGGVPGFEKGMGAERFDMNWTRPAFADAPGKLPPRTQYILWRDRVAGYGVAIPLVGGGVKSDFEPYKNKLSVIQASFDSGFKPDETPVVAIAWGLNPYETTNLAYRVGMDFMDTPGRMRVDKGYPEIFEYFGWSSRNAFHGRVTTDDVVSAAASFVDQGFPLGFVLVDDGWQDTGPDATTRKSKTLHGFGANEEKFPGGIKALSDKLEEELGITRLGVWHTYQGYWEGVAPGSDLAHKYRDALLKTISGKLVPNPKKRKGLRFFNDYHRSLRDAGVDFVKVGNQSATVNFTMHRLPISYAADGWRRNLQRSVSNNFGDGLMINDACMTIENIYYWKDSNASRSSADYFPTVPDDARAHVLHNIYNCTWYSELTWPDFDAFQSHDPWAVTHSVLHAISGGPIYVSDVPGQQDWDILWKLVFSDGRVPRADAPPHPTRDLLLVDPSIEPVPLKAFTRTADVGIIGAFNVLDSGGDVSGTVSPSDVEGLEGKRFASFEHFTGDLKILSPKDKLPVKLGEFGCRLYSFVPIIDGVAPIGLLDKYLSSAAVSKKTYSDDYVEIDLRDGGTFGAWLEAKPLALIVKDARGGARAVKKETWTYENHFLKVQLDRGRPLTLKIYVQKRGCKCKKDCKKQKMKTD